MGNTLSSWGGQKRVQGLIQRSGLPLQIDNSQDDDAKKPLSTFTEAYPAPGWFTGVKSAITIQKPVSEIYDSLSKDLQHVFTPMSECDDEIRDDDGEGKQTIFRIVRIPFKVAFVTGNLKLRLNVQQDRKAGKIHFESAKEGRLITRFIADFDIHASPDRPEETIVMLDSKVSCKSLPPAPFKNMVKDVMVRKMDSCMVDLLNYHNQDLSDDDEFASACGDSIDESQPQSPSKPANQKSSYTGFLDMMRSLSAPLRHSFELLDRRLSTERSRAPNLQDTAQDSLGHSPNQIGPEVQTSPPTQSQLDASLRASQSSLYKPSSESCGPRNEDGVQQKSSQADVFESWQKENRVPHSPFMTASN